MNAREEKGRPDNRPQENNMKESGQYKKSLHDCLPFFEGAHFCRIPKVNGTPSKGPMLKGWNLPASDQNPNGYTANFELVQDWLDAGDNIGLCHEPSGTMAFDIDDLDETRRVFTELGLPLDEWLNDPNRVEIQSGKENRAKLIFRRPEDFHLSTRRLAFGMRSIFELRSNAENGNTVQDVWPPSIHPDTKQPYRLVVCVDSIPELPQELADLWQHWREAGLETFDPSWQPPDAEKPPQSKQQAVPGQRDAIAKFNAAHSLQSFLEKHGYRRKGKRWLAPNSSSGIPGVTILGEGQFCYSHHASDPLNDGFKHDAFDVFRLLSCGGDWSKAMGWDPDLTKHNQRAWAKAQGGTTGQADFDDQGRKPIRQCHAVSLEEMLTHSFPRREFILEPVFTLGSLNMIYAWRGIGKTHVALGIAYAAACGGQFWNWKANRFFRVLYLDGEMPGETIQERLFAIVQAANCKPPPDFLRFVSIDLEDGFMPDLASREGHAQIAEECDRAELIVVDNLSCLVRGSGKENEANSWTEVQEWALSMRSRGKCVLFIHHAGKDGAQRGTSKREDLLDTSIRLKRPFDYQIDEGARFEVSFEKARHLTGPDSQSFEAWLQADEHGRQMWTTKLVSVATYDRVIDLANLGLSQHDIAEELGIHKSNVSRHMAKAVRDGLIKKEPGRIKKKVIVEADWNEE